jgi:uncharacterized protein DUF6232
MTQQAVQVPVTPNDLTFFEGNGVAVTATRLVIGGKTYAMAHITSVRMSRVPADRAAGYLLIIGGIVLMTIGLGVALLLRGNLAPLIVAAGLVIGLLVSVIGIVLAVMAKPTFMVRIEAASGEVETIINPDVTYIQKIGRAVSDAIVRRGLS